MLFSRMWDALRAFWEVDIQGINDHINKWSNMLKMPPTLALHSTDTPVMASHYAHNLPNKIFTEWAVAKALQLKNFQESIHTEVWIPLYHSLLIIHARELQCSLLQILHFVLRPRLKKRLFKPHVWESCTLSRECEACSGAAPTEGNFISLPWQLRFTAERILEEGRYSPPTHKYYLFPNKACQPVLYKIVLSLKDPLPFSKCWKKRNFKKIRESRVGEDQFIHVLVWIVWGLILK